MCQGVDRNSVLYLEGHCEWIGRCESEQTKKTILLRIVFFAGVWPRLESNRDLELRRLSYYPLYYEAGGGKVNSLQMKIGDPLWTLCYFW